ncbi:MAG TPA: PQQ-binding-like beta-propeller repeat protein [Gemmataceae bacterium]|nr:PQQ-binding-like beta-propeller repeat protein [Gemmataceae bacterium]
MPFLCVRHLKLCSAIALAIVAVLGLGANAHAQDWLQWRGPLGQGTTTAPNLPPAAGTDSLKVRWKTAIPGDGCSSPIVCDGRVYLTTAYEGTQQHPLDEPGRWLALVLACGAIGLALTQLPRFREALARRPALIAALGVWTLAVIVLTGVVLAKPTWFWQYADPWTGTTVAPAELACVESLHLRPAIVVAFGSLLLIFISLAKLHSGPEESPADRALTDWLDLVSICITLVAGVLLTLIAWRPEPFVCQPWLAWVVIGGIALFAFAGTLAGLGSFGKVRLALTVLGVALGGRLFANVPPDEFIMPVGLQNRIVFLVPAALFFLFQPAAVFLQRNVRHGANVRGILGCAFMALLGAIVFFRANYLQPQSGIVRAVVCVDAANGEILWNTPVYVALAERKHSLNSLATPTPACDGKRIYAYFGSGLAALDLDGRILWLKRDDAFREFIRYGAGSSVALADDKILIYRDSEFVGHGDHLDDDIEHQVARRSSALIAYDKASGAEVWNVTPAFSHDSYVTPIVWQRGDRREAVIATWKTLAGIDVRDGAVLWSHPYPMQQIVPSPAVNGDCLIVTGGNKIPCPIVVVRAPSEMAPVATVWSNSKTGGNIVSPVCWDGLLFSTSHVGVLTCRDADTGRIHWTERLGSRCLASLVAGDGKVYALDQEGMLQVFAADADERELARHDFRETCAATPALTANAIYVRTSRHLYCME